MTGLDSADCFALSQGPYIRAIYRPFGSTSSKSAKIGTYVHNSILFRFLPGAKSGAP